jgi:hypothetical protein
MDDFVGYIPRTIKDRSEDFGLEYMDGNNA